MAQQELHRADAALDEQLQESLEALAALRAFEVETARLSELEDLASRADEIADEWTRDRLAKPASVASLLDEAFAARNAIVDARERAAQAHCTLLVMTGALSDSW